MPLALEKPNSCRKADVALKRFFCVTMNKTDVPFLFDSCKIDIDIKRDAHNSSTIFGTTYV